MKTEQEVREEYNQLLNDDSNFYIQWNVPYSDDDNKPYTMEQQNKMNNNNFYEWCSNYDDTKHIIKQKKGTNERTSNKRKSI